MMVGVKVDSLDQAHPYYTAGVSSSLPIPHPHTSYFL